MADKIFSASDVEGDYVPETPNIFHTGQMIQRAVDLCGGVTIINGRLMCNHSDNCGLPKIQNAIKNALGDDRKKLLAIATPALIAATIGTENDFPPLPEAPVISVLTRESEVN